MVLIPAGSLSTSISNPSLMSSFQARATVRRLTTTPAGSGFLPSKKYSPSSGTGTPAASQASQTAFMRCQSSPGGRIPTTWVDIDIGCLLKGLREQVGQDDHGRRCGDD